MNLNILNDLLKKFELSESNNAAQGDKKNSSTLNRITALIVSSMVFCMVSAVALSIFTFNRNYMRDTTNSISHIANGAFRIIEDWANNLRTLTSAVSTRPDLVAAVNGTSSSVTVEEIISRMAEQSDFDIMAITDSSGVVIEGGGYNTDSGDDLSSSRSFQNATIDNPILTFEPLGNLDFVMAIGMPIKDEDGEIIGVLIFFSIVPIFPILAVSMTKDILFTAAFIASFVKILELNENGFQSYRIWDWAEILVFFVLTAMLRNNGQYAVFAVLAAFFVKSLFNRKNIKYAYVLAVTTVLLISVSNNVLMAVTKAVPGTKNQMLSLPYQQLSRVYKYDHAVFSKEDEASVKRLIPKAGHYNEHRSDAVMWSATVFNSRENQKLFARIYFEYLLKKPLRYVEAFLINTSGFWYLDDISSSQMYGKLPHGIRDDFGLFLMDTKPGFGVTHESKLQWLDDLIKALFHENKYQNFPVIASIFNMGTYFWLLVLSVFYCVQVKNNRAVVPLVFVLAYTATLFAGPCALFRYALSFIVCIPAFWVTVYSKKLPQTSSNPSAAA